MNAFLFIVLVLLFVALTPNILLSLPPKASKLTVAFTHGLVFAVVWTLIHKPSGALVRAWACAWRAWRASATRTVIAMMVRSASLAPVLKPTLSI